jgi:Acetyltransferase (GNAT) domain
MECSEVITDSPVQMLQHAGRQHARPPTTSVQCRWYATADQVPAWPSAATPYATREWARAWQHVYTEPVLEARCARITTGNQTCVATYYLITHSPAWAAFEAEAGVRDAWRGQPVVYGPSPYATYGGVGVTRPAMMQAVTAAGLAFARDTGACAFVAPGLREDQAHRWAAATPDAILVRTTGAHQAAVGGSLEAFQKAITHSPKARQEFGRQLRRGEDAGLRLEILPGTQITPDLPAFTALASAAASRHGTSLYGPDILSAVASAPGSVFLAARHGSHLAGALLCLRHASTLHLWAAGLDYDVLPQLHTYGWLMASAVRYAAQTGATAIDFGRGNYGYKRRLGCRMVRLFSLCWLTRDDPHLAAALTEMGRRITAATAPWDTGNMP